MTNFAAVAALIAVLLAGSASAALAGDAPPRLVEFESPLAGPQALQGYLRLPDGPGPSPAVVLMHGCGGAWRGIDARWGKLLAEWGYVTLAIDRFGTRGITSACTGGLPPSTLHDAYRALNFLAGQSSVDPSRVAVVGFSQGGMLALLSVERGEYVFCGDFDAGCRASGIGCNGAGVFAPPVFEMGEIFGHEGDIVCRHVLHGLKEIAACSKQYGGEIRLAENVEDRQAVGAVRSARDGMRITIWAGKESAGCGGNMCFRLAIG